MNYHGILNMCRHGGKIVCVGNSSSGIKETPAFSCPTVNIGTRQNGRLRAENVLDARYEADDICAKVDSCLYDERFISIYKNCSNPYGDGGAGKKIADFVAKIPINSRLLQKKMTI
jgi:UDP-N-acetylglucosamine 2-epimerase (non-hydrolysing)/GDP/UDP-N,N'-diacetylbacillosamine 2-epimerase (hydrolysing)